MCACVLFLFQDSMERKKRPGYSRSYKSKTIKKLKRKFCQEVLEHPNLLHNPNNSTTLSHSNKSENTASIMSPHMLSSNVTDKEVDQDCSEMSLDNGQNIPCIITGPEPDGIGDIQPIEIFNSNIYNDEDNSFTDDDNDDKIM